MITKITCRYSFEVSIINCNGFGFINKTRVGYPAIYDINVLPNNGKHDSRGMKTIYHDLSRD